MWHVVCEKEGEHGKENAKWAKKETTMSAVNHLTASHGRKEVNESLFRRMAAATAKMSEIFWLGLTFLLFIVMGPFSVIGVIYGLWALGSGENRERMVEPASC